MGFFLATLRLCVRSGLSSLSDALGGKNIYSLNLFSKIRSNPCKSVVASFPAAMAAFLLTLLTDGSIVDLSRKVRVHISIPDFQSEYFRMEIAFL